MAISKTEGGAAPAVDTSGMSEEDRESAARVGYKPPEELGRDGETIEVKDLLLEKYKSSETSELTADVKPGEGNVFDFPLTE